MTCGPRYDRYMIPLVPVGLGQIGIFKENLISLLSAWSASQTQSSVNECSTQNNTKARTLSTEASGADLSAWVSKLASLSFKLTVAVNSLQDARHIVLPGWSLIIKKGVIAPCQGTSSYWMSHFLRDATKGLQLPQSDTNLTRDTHQKNFFFVL